MGSLFENSKSPSYPTLRNTIEILKKNALLQLTRKDKHKVQCVQLKSSDYHTIKINQIR